MSEKLTVLSGKLELAWWYFTGQASLPIDFQGIPESGGPLMLHVLGTTGTRNFPLGSWSVHRVPLAFPHHTLSGFPWEAGVDRERERTGP
ncbi:MAG: hypothetical protein A2284_12430 [Deltaproteobacteria bacterium RIFOXYA12_FULL_61_11]|nr:MAG: hypothetical protein A2284_12430 [Deltaproteobacteria bacterium RIFOXYA12_FULL_61_11]